MKKLFNEGWEFVKVPLGTKLEQILTSMEWTAVDLPHDWMIYDTSNLYEDSIGCYRKHFAVKDAHKQYFIRFEGVYMDTTVYLNGVEIFQWKYGYSTFEINLTNSLNLGENEIVVKCVYQSPNSRWYSGAGIYRNVWLLEKEDCYLVSDGTYLSTVKEEGQWRVLVDVETKAVEGVETEQAVLSHTIYDGEWKQITEASMECNVSGEVDVNHQELIVADPVTWDVDHPYLYHITTKLLVNGTEVDSVTQNLGFRTIRFDADKGFFLNEHPCKINGACEHHDLGALGAVMNRQALRRKFEALKEMGVNSVRSSHNMPAVEFMELADEMGLLVYTESFDMWERTKTEYDYGCFFKEWWQRDITSWVRRDRNHPSLILWGIGNEIYDTHIGTGLEITKNLCALIHELDPRRNGYTAIGSNYIEWENAQRCSDEVDVSGYNYSERLYDAHHIKYPNWCIFGSETASTVQSRGIYHFPLSNRLLTHEDQQCSCLGNCTVNWGGKDVDTVVSTHRDRDFVFGQYIWTGWDYIGEPTPYFSKNSFFGQIDTAGFKKDTYYHYQAEWTDYRKHPMIHILPYWDFNVGQIIDVCVYSNAPEVELFLNGQSLGRQFIDHEHGTVLQGTWQVPYEKGCLTAYAYGSEGNVVAKEEVYSFEDAAQLVILPDKYRMQADGQDLVFVEISAIDQHNHPVSNARNRVEVQVTGAGRLVGLDNGDSTDYDSYKGTSRRMFSGKLMAIIAAKKEPGLVHIKVSSPGLKSASVDLAAVKTEILEGICASEENKTSEVRYEIPVRKIELTNQGAAVLTKEEPETIVTAKVYPEDTTYPAITFRAMTLDGIESNCVIVKTEGNTARLIPRGDGKFRLCCSANNDKEHPEVISELEFSIEGFGTASIDPYQMVPACQCSQVSQETKVSLLGGIYLGGRERTSITFEQVDFGEFGSDEITIPIFSFRDEERIEVWIGELEKDASCMFAGVYRAKSIYNQYQSNTFRLSQRVKGIQTVNLIVQPEENLTIQGFIFTKKEKAYEVLKASDKNRITGDMFQIEEDAITGIGNNVAIEYTNLDFGVDGFRSVTICGRSHIDVNTIHIRFNNGEKASNQIVEFAYSEDYMEQTFELESVYGCNHLNLIFLPGSDFDLRYIQFHK